MDQKYKDNYFDDFGGEELNMDNINIKGWICFQFLSRYSSETGYRTAFGKIIHIEYNEKYHEDIYRIRCDVSCDNDQLPNFLQKYIKIDHCYSSPSILKFTMTIVKKYGKMSEKKDKIFNYENPIFEYDNYNIKDTPRILVNEKQYLKNIKINQTKILSKKCENLESKLDQVIDAINDTREHIETIERKFD